MFQKNKYNYMYCIISLCPLTAWGGGAQVKALADKSAKNAIFFTCSLRGPCYLHFLQNQKIKGEKNRHLYKIYVLVNFNGRD